MTDVLAKHPNEAIRLRALSQIKAATRMRAYRFVARQMAFLLTAQDPDKKLNRLVYDAKGGDVLPGDIVRRENGHASQDPAVENAFKFAGDTHQFYKEVYDRNSLDDNGMTLISSVHVGEFDADTGEVGPMNNAFWNGEQMAYGDGDRVIFKDFTDAIEVVGHELTHGVQSYTSNLVYQGEPGALNEHFADVFGVLLRQWKNQQNVSQADWVVGGNLLVTPNPNDVEIPNGFFMKGLRDMENPGKAYFKHPYLGNDPQPDNYENRYTGGKDHGGVHLNSGIANRAFVLAAKALGGHAWETAGKIWYDSLRQLSSTSTFSQCAKISVQVASDVSDNAKQAVREAWRAVKVPGV